MLAATEAAQATSEWYVPGVSVGTLYGVFDGTRFQSGMEEAPVTRAELALMAVNALEAAGKRPPDTLALMEAYFTVPDIGGCTQDEQFAICCLYALGIVSGNDEAHTYEPGNKLTRAEAAKILLGLADAPDDSPAPQEPDSPDAPALDADSVYSAMTALKDEYPEGTPWDNGNYYGWKGGVFSGGYGCAGFAFMLSDAAFGDLPARRVDTVRFEDVRPGDILRINGNTHSVIVLQVLSDGVIIAEGNFNNSVHWGRELTRADVENADYMLTRYPE